MCKKSEQILQTVNTYPECRFDYGKKCCLPRFCQTVFNRAEWMLVFWCVAAFAQSGYMNGTANAVLTTLERRYQLTSTEVGFIVTVNDITTILVVALVSYYGGRGRKPRWVGIGCLFLGLGSLTFALPHAVFGQYEFSAIGEPICNVGGNIGNTTMQCETSQPGRSSYFIFLVAQFFAGIGSTPLYTVGITYLDENSGPKRASLYTGIFMTMWVVGPAAGFIFTGMSLNYYVDVSVEPTITSDSPLWVGAWWLPFLFFGFFIIVFGFIPIYAYPTELPETKLRNMNALAGQQTSASTHAGFSGNRASLMKALRTVATNKTFWLISLGTACNSFTSGMFATFGAKLLHDMFGVSPSNAAFYFGAVIVPGAGIGTFLGGYILKRHKLSMKQILTWMTAVGIATVPPLFGFLLSCSGAPYAGLYHSYPLQTANVSTNSSSWLKPSFMQTGPNLTSWCNSQCSCAMESFTPICGADGVQYYSPCFAGCTAYSVTPQKVYYQCECIQPPETMVANSTFNTRSYAVSGQCDSNSDEVCLFPVFLVLLFFIALLQFSAAVPIIQVLIRCVPESCSSVSLGLNSLVFRLLGVIPGPIIGGAIFDHFCTFWQRIGCFRDDSCLAYDMASVRVALMIVCIMMHLLQVLFYILARKYFKPPTEDEAQGALEMDTTVNDSVQRNLNSQSSLSSNDRQELWTFSTTNSTHDNCVY